MAAFFKSELADRFEEPAHGRRFRLVEMDDSLAGLPDDTDGDAGGTVRLGVVSDPHFVEPGLRQAAAEDGASLAFALLIVMNV